MPALEILSDLEGLDAARLLDPGDALILAVQKFRAAPAVGDPHGGKRDQKDRSGNEKIGVRYRGHHAMALALGAA